METMALDNVIRFPETARSSLGDSDRVRILREARDLAAQKLREAVRALISVMEADFEKRADAAEGSDRRAFCYGGQVFLRENAVRLEGLFAAGWLMLFDAAIAGGVRKSIKGPVSALDELELVDLVDMDEDIAVKAVAGRLNGDCEDGLFAASRRLAFLAGRDDDSIEVAKMLADAMQAALKEAGMSGALRLEMLRNAERLVASAFAPVIHDLNAFLVGRNVLSKLRRSYGKPTGGKPRQVSTEPSGDVFALLQKLIGPTVAAASGAAGQGGSVPVSFASMAAAMERAIVQLDALQHAVPAGVAMVPSTSILREFRASGVGQELGHLDAVTVDIVATLFDFVFDDEDIADPIKALVARLQIPVLKVAMLDKSFFSSKAHPARRLLDVISRAAARCGPDVGHGDPLYARVADIVDRLQSGFAQDASLFESLCDELNAFLEVQEDEADARAVRAAPLVAERERRELAAMAADEVLSRWLSVPLPSAVADLLAHEWRALLVRHYLKGGDAAWDLAVSTAAELVASTAPRVDAQGRKALAGKLPTLVKNIHMGLDKIHVTTERRLALFDCLFSIHAAVLRGAAPVVTTLWPKAQAVPEIVSETIATDEAQVDCISLVGADDVPAEVEDGEAQERVAELRRGDWVEFKGESGPVRYRLSWVSPERGILLFTNPQSPRALSVAPAALALQVERGEASIVPVEPIFDRAVNRALESLKAA
ncbi:MAG: DUF1631 family protein [Rhodocyclaceae bacterium]|jgi:hypothetical protein|nr:DUF1631 family protein [Rhodocyclaceae bacterium]MBK9312024.1 DUF1631 family protein [Rhodocyclaceae bacterium]